MLRFDCIAGATCRWRRRYELLIMAARVVFEEAFQKRDVDSTCAATGELANQLTDLVNYKDIRLFDLVEVMLHDYSTYAHATPSMPNDHRRFPRVRCRSKRHRAALKRLPTFAALASSQQWSAVYVADFSKTGVQVLHAEQLFPGERLRLLLLTGNLLDLEVVRCRRMGDACFAVGTQIVRDEA